MDLRDSIQQLAGRVERLKDRIETEEATKNAFIMPLIAALGYDVFDPMEVVPELNCDINKKKGEKIDYAIVKDNTPIILIECKHWNQDLDLHSTQLKGYYVASKARFGVLTNGIEYRFYTDLERPNIMDEKPFLVIDITDMSDADIEQLKKFHKSYYDESNILSTAQELKYTTELRAILMREFSQPSPEFVRFFMRQAYTGQLTQRVIDQFTPVVKKAINAIINDTISDRLNLALKDSKNADDSEATATVSTEAQTDSNTDNDCKVKGIETTQEELDCYHIVRAILRNTIDVKRIAYRDHWDFFNILLDNNRRKPICRARFNKKTKYFSTFAANKAETRHEINSLDELFQYADRIIETVKNYDNNN